jgi:hypothetical protein
MLSSNSLFGAVQKVHINVPLIDLSGFVSIALQNCETSSRMSRGTGGLRKARVECRDNTVLERIVVQVLEFDGSQGTQSRRFQPSLSFCRMLNYECKAALKP